MAEHHVPSKQNSDCSMMQCRSINQAQVLHFFTLSNKKKSDFDLNSIPTALDWTFAFVLSEFGKKNKQKKLHSSFVN